MRTVKNSTHPETNDRTAQIYNTAAQIFHKHGFDAATMDEVAEAVGLTKAGLYYYVKSKQELLFAIMDHAMDLTEEMVVRPAQAETDPEQRLRAIIRCHVRLVAQGNRAITILTDEVSGLTPRHRRHIVARKRRYLALVKETLTTLKTTRKLRDVNLTVAAFSLFGTILWVPRWFRPDGSLTTDQLVQEIVNIVLRGLLKDVP